MKLLRILLPLFLVLVLALGTTLVASADKGGERPQAGEYDLIIENGTVMDPGNGVEMEANVGIKDGKIAVITTEKIRGGKVIDAEGLVVSPGFIDIHTHQGSGLYSAQCFARQGVTLTLGGLCGGGVSDTGDWLAELELPINVAMCAGHGYARRAVGLTSWDDVATPAQVEEMRPILQNELAEGAIAVSMGLEYVPFSSAAEVLMCFEVAAEYDTFVTSHVRADCWDVLEAIDEMAFYSQETGAPVIITHLAYMAGFGQMTEALELIDQYRAEGVKIGSDSGDYWAFSTGLSSAVFNPGWRAEYDADYSDLLFLSGPYAGEYATEDTFNEMRAAGGISVAAFVGVEDECAEALDHVFAGDSYVMLSSDGSMRGPGQGHPQGGSTCPRLLAWQREGKVEMTLMEAIAKMTIRPAQWLGLNDKGRIQVGADADITIFDPDTVQDYGDFPVEGTGQLPDAPPDGIPYVIVNGVLVVEDGELTGALSGVGIARTSPPYLVWPEWRY